jgi:hypothetical protein
MVKNKRLVVAFGVSVFAAGFVAGQLAELGSVVEAQSDKVYELRTYTALPGRLDALNARFRDHTTRIFRKHGMSNVGYWVPQDDPLAENTLIYIISHPSREAAAENWNKFREDAEWQQVAEESQRDGRIVASVDAVFMDATDYSQIQ